MANTQFKTPIFTAVKKYYEEGIIPFHVPGHKQGKGLAEFMDYVGSNTLGIDLTCTPDLDNICNPNGVIEEAEHLTAKLYGSDQAYFLVNGTTSGIQTMIMSTCQPGDKIIIPRNAHKSALGGLILSGAIPVYVDPEINLDFGISMGISNNKINWSLKQHPDAKALMVINPNYYGTTSDIAKIVQMAHLSDIPVIVDEAHGSHLNFHPDLPISAIKAGADISACSTHKLIGSLTQSSVLLVNEGLIDPSKVKSTLNLTQTTSPSYLLLSSIDVARKQMATNGYQLMGKVLNLSLYLRDELKKIKGINLLDGGNIVGSPGCYDFDCTKVTINVCNLGISGFEMERILRSEFKIQVELSDLFNVVFIITIGDDWQKINLLIDALKTISFRLFNEKIFKFSIPLPEIPPLVASPREAFYYPSKKIELHNSIGEISAEAIMAYPPGIPIIAPGERITEETINYINLLKQEKALLQGTEDPQLYFIKVIKSLDHKTYWFTSSQLEINHS